MATRSFSRTRTDATLTSKGQLTVPADVRRRLGLKPGDRLRFEVTGPDRGTVKVCRKADVFEYLAALPKLPERGAIDREAVGHAQSSALGAKFGRRRS